MEKLDERRRMEVQHIEAIQWRRKITFDKRCKKRALRPCMMVLIQDARKLEFPDKFDAVWLGPYLVCEAFLNNFLQLETLNGKIFPTRMSGISCLYYMLITNIFSIMIVGFTSRESSLFLMFFLSLPYPQSLNSKH